MLTSALGRGRNADAVPGTCGAIDAPRVSREFWFTIKKAGYFLLKKGTFYRVCGPEISQYPRFGSFYENLPAGSVSIVPFFQKNFEKRATLTQGGGA